MKSLVASLALVFVFGCATTSTSNRDRVDEALRARKGEFYECFKREVRAGTKLSSGKIDIQFYIKKNGRAAKASILNSTIYNANVENCVLALVLSTQFATHKDNAFKVIYPFSYKTPRDKE